MRKKLLGMTASFVGAVMACYVTSPSAHAGSIENLERERTILINNILSPDLSAEERQEKLKVSKRRLLDLERIVLRDKSLTGKNTPAVRRAFANYDLTFLVHSAAENKRDIGDYWFEQIGLTGQNVLSATKRRR